MELSQRLGAFLEWDREAASTALVPGQPALRGVVLDEQGFLMSEEIYLRRQNLRQRFVVSRSWLLLVLQGRLVFDPGGRERTSPMVLASDGVSLCLTASLVQEFTVIQTPLQLLRIGLPLKCSWWPADFHACHRLPLLLPMLRLLLQAPSEPRERLLEALQTYCRTELEIVGVALRTAPHRDPLGALEDWLSERLDQPLSLADLAAAACLSPRRLQELAQERYGYSPMELLRQLRLQALHRQLVDPSHQHETLAILYQRWQLSQSGSTQQAFKARYGQSPAALRRVGFRWKRS